MIWRRKREPGDLLGEPGGWGSYGLVPGFLAADRRPDPGDLGRVPPRR